MKRILFYILLFIASAPVQAQDGEEYKMELGAGVGLMGYLGDFNSSLTKDLQPMGTLLARYAFSPYMGLKFNVSYGKMQGKSSDVKTYYPKFSTKPYEFSNALVDVGVAYEYNFWPYGTGRDYRGAQPLTPYIVGGLGLTHVSGGEKNVATANLFLGVGVKYKLAERLNLGLEWAMHFATSDKLDGVADPYTVGSVGMFKNKDGYSALSLSLTYSFMPKCRTCNKDD